MPLQEACTSFLGDLLVVKPVYGWGWSRLDAPEIPVPAEINGVPRPFHCRVREFFYFRNELRGAIGTIEESGHIYDRHCVIFWTRTIGMHNFIDSLPYCNVEIGSVAPVGEWPEFRSGSPMINGYGIVGASLEHIKVNEARTLLDAKGAC